MAEDNTHIDNSLYFDTTAAGFEPGDLFVGKMVGRHTLSSLFEVQLELQCNIDGGISPEAADALLDASCAVSFGPAGVAKTYGVLRELERVDNSPDGKYSANRADLVPRFWLATLTRRSRVFNEKTIPEILEQVLAEMNLAPGGDFELRLAESYPIRECVVQYEESDFAFLCRWMERCGMFYFFTHDEGVDKLVITDGNSQLVAVTDHPECLFSGFGDTMAIGGIHAMTRRHRKMSEKVECRDFNWRTPATPLVGEHDIDAAFGTGEVVHYGDHFKDNSEGAKMAQVRAESLGTQKTTFRGKTVHPDFGPGHRFSVSGSPVAELDLEYVLTSVTHYAEQANDAPGSGRYHNELEAIMYETPYRAPFVTPWPRIDGVMHAKIDAESVSSAAPIDDQGRYKVVMPYDRYGEYGGKATRWVRKAEPYAGASHGMHFTLHVGAEVLLAHTGGDPDRPIIVGAVPNPSTTSPLTSVNATRSAIITRSGIVIDLQDDASP